MSKKTNKTNHVLNLLSTGVKKTEEKEPVNKEAAGKEPANKEPDKKEPRDGQIAGDSVEHKQQDDNAETI